MNFINTFFTMGVTGEHHLTITATFTTLINDGTAENAAGDYVLDYAVYLKP